MIRSLVTRGLQAAIAAALMRAGIAAACPTPPQTNQCVLEPTTVLACTDSGPSDLDVRINAGQKTSNAAHPDLTNYWRVNLLATRNYGWGGVNVCDGMILFTVDDITAGLAENASTPLRNVRITGVERVSSPGGSGTQPYYERHGSGAFCLWATEAVARYNQIYQVTVEAFDLEGNVHQGQVAVEVVCTEDANATPAPTSQTTYYQSEVREAFCTHMNTECVAEAALPETCGDVCQCDCIPTAENNYCGAGDGDCIPVEGYGCGGDTGGGDTGGGDTGDGGSGDGSGDGGSDCVPVEGYGCGTAEDGTAPGASGSSGSSGSTDSGSGTSGSEGTSEAASSAAPRSGGCSAFPFADPSLGALILLGLGLLRRRRSN
jgi:hypothetical protein